MARSRSKRKNTYCSPEPEIKKITPKTEHQKEMMISIRSNPITIAEGVAGSGKSLVALHEAVQMKEWRTIDKILYIKPNVDFGKTERGVGYLKGDVKEKLQPLLFPVLDNLQIFCSKGKMMTLISDEVIEVGLLEYLRGRSLHRTFVILDEAQNCDPHSILTVISRLDDTSTLVVCGDTMQCDIGMRNNGLADAVKRLRGLEEVGIVHFTTEDIVRSSYLKKVITRYQEF